MPVSFAAISSEPGMNENTKIVQLEGDQMKSIDINQGEIYVKYPLDEQFHQQIWVVYDSNAEASK